MKNKCKDCLNKKIECELCGKFFSKKRLRSHYEREHQPKIDIVNERITLTEKQKQDNNTTVSTNENHAYVVIGPKNVGKTYYILKILEKIGNKRRIHKITRSPN